MKHTSPVIQTDCFEKLFAMVYSDLIGNAKLDIGFVDGFSCNGLWANVFDIEIFSNFRNNPLSFIQKRYFIPLKAAQDTRYKIKDLKLMNLNRDYFLNYWENRS